MAHTCPDCGKYCTCSGDFEDADMGEWIGCQCPCHEEEDFDDEWEEDNSEDDDDPNDSRNL